MQKIWKIKTPHPKQQRALSDALHVHPVVAQLLVNRNITDPVEARGFLSAALSDLHDPMILKDMDKVIARLTQAKERQESVLIFGDYDVDGVTSSALLRRLLKRIGVKAVNYIPHRMDEGYGLNHGIVELAREQGIHLLITVDCGINAFSEVDALNAAGMDVIVIDHHEPDGDQLPKALAVINPKRRDCPYPFKKLSAVGLVAKLVQAVLGKIPEEELDLVALGTIADVVELQGENRIFVKRGLPFIERTTKHGLRALMDVAKITGKKMRPYYVGFILGPRINAAGRMDSARISLDLLLCDNSVEAIHLAEILESQNLERQKMQRSIVQEAIDIIENSVDLKDRKIIVVHKEGWHKGVLGIVASRIVEKYYRPTVVMTVENGIATGSARSVEGFHLFEALTQCSQNLEHFGGHKRAAGLTLRSENIEAFREAINGFAQDQINLETLAPTLDIDAEVPLDLLTQDFTDLIASLEPYGEGNPEPVFCSRGLTVKGPASVMGKGTLKFWVTDGRQTISVVGFGMAEDFKGLVNAGRKIDLAYHLSIDDWNKTPTVQLRLKDLRPSEG